MKIPTDTAQYVSVGGDFVNIFDHEDYIAMVNTLDEATLILKAHLILEEFLNIWASKVTNTQDLFAGSFVPFKTKLLISKNLGLSTDLFEILDKFNDVRNRFSHRRKYKIDPQTIESIKTKVNNLPSLTSMLPCEQFEIWIEGVDSSGEKKQISYTWTTADSKKKLLIAFIILVMKFISWMQTELNLRGIQYKIISTPAL